jgi:putative membrane protein
VIDVPHHLAWKPDPFAAALLAASAGWYVIGMWRMHRHGGLTHVPRLEIASFAAGWMVLAVALLSPIATMSEWLFSVHMGQHELLMLVAAPLLAIGRPITPMLFALPHRMRRAASRAAGGGAIAIMTAPLVVFALHAMALWIWHLPALYEAAVLNEGVHIIQHICFTATAALFWWSLIRGRYGRLGYGAALLYIFGTALHSGGLGALLALSPVPWYPLYVERSPAFGEPLVDQQLGGMLMWVPSGAVMMLLALALFAAWLGEGERRRRKGWSP